MPCAPKSLLPIISCVYICNKNITEPAGAGRYICFAPRHASATINMEGDARTARPKGGPNTDHLKKARKKHTSFDAYANTEYLRLLSENNKKQLTPNNDPAQHALFYWLCELRAGVMLF